MFISICSVQQRYRPVRPVPEFRQGHTAQDEGIDRRKASYYCLPMAERPDTGSPREGAKRLKTIDWVYWKISSIPFLVDGVSWSSLAGGAWRSAQAVALWPSGLQSGWDPAAKWWRRT
jgi:hypothetical protein